MIKKTKEYDKFKFRDDNRFTLNQAHIARLVESIKFKNLLELRPISINMDYEIIDGQHRLLAAKQLGVDIYYEINEKLNDTDIILMNTSMAWGLYDYLNYYCKNGFEEYLKLEKFMKSNNISLKIALSITMGQSKNSYKEYKNGKYIFKDEVFNDKLENCWDTINYIKKMNGFAAYTSSARFWKALVKLTQHRDFDYSKWKENLSKMIERFSPRASIDDYYRLMMEVYNWRNNLKIDLMD